MVCWVWRRGRRQWNEKLTRRRTDDWVRVRHAIVHSYALPNDLESLQGDNGDARLTLGQPDECLRHQKHVALKTDDAPRDPLVNSYGMAAPW